LRNRLNAPGRACIGTDTVQASHKTGHLLRILGTGFGLAVGVGNTIGSGIFRTPGVVAGHLGRVSLVYTVWILGGVYALLCSSSVTELGTMLPSAGGWYVYAERAFGRRIGFVVGCCDWMVESVAMAYLAVALGEFAAGLYPGLAEHVQFVGVTGLALLALLNWIGLRPGSRAQELTSLVKAIGLIALVIACFLISPGSTASAPSAVTKLLGQRHSFFLGLVLALQGVIVTYDGWYAPIYFVEEDQNPSRNLPRAMIGTTLTCIAIFLLMNAAMLHVLGMNHLAHSQMPAADAAMLVFGSHGKQIILVISVVAVISTINAGLLLTPRILYGMARDGLLPHGVTAVNKGGTPAWALLLCSSASITLVLFGTFDALVAIAAILFVAVYISGFAALLVLRRREPNLPRPYKAWWYPWTTLCVLFASGAFLIGSVIGDLAHSLFTVILILLSYVAALLITRRKADSTV
jgi:APA family basic amino acid/polyamine antiporter